MKRFLLFVCLALCLAFVFSCGGGGGGASYSGGGGTQTAATPTFSPSPDAGPVTAGTTVTVSSATPGATVYVGQMNPPTTQATTFSVNSAGTWYAQAKHSGYRDSAVASATYTIGVPVAATPTFSPTAGTVAANTTVTVSSATPGATLYVGQMNPPTTQASSFTVNGAGTWYAQARHSGYTDSAVASATYAIGVPVAATPTFSPTAGTVAQNTAVTVSSATSGATLYVGQMNPPTTQASSFTVNGAGTWYAQARHSGYTDSAVASATYTITATLNWTAPTVDADHGAQTGYYIYYCFSSSGECTAYDSNDPNTNLLTQTPLASTATSYAHTGRTSGYHCYDVIAYNSGGRSPSACADRSAVNCCKHY